MTISRAEQLQLRGANARRAVRDLDLDPCQALMLVVWPTPAVLAAEAELRERLERQRMDDYRSHRQRVYDYR